MKKYSLLILFICFFALLAQAQTAFPVAWAGKWQGEMHLYKGTSDKPYQQVNISMQIAPASNGEWHWQIKYGLDSADVRPYRLLPKDTTSGHWVIDENNGIVLDQYLLAGTLTGVFTVGKSTIINRYWLENDRLVVEFITYNAKAISRTGLGTTASPTVEGFEVKGYQKGLLQRVR